MPIKIIVRGGGDLASGVALRLFRLGLDVIITELSQPLFVRRAVSFGEAVYRGQTQVEEVTGVLARDLDHCTEILKQGQLPVLIDPSLNIAAQLKASLPGSQSEGVPCNDRCAHDQATSRTGNGCGCIGDWSGSGF